MHLRNRHGTPVDPVPFVVVVGLTFMVLLSFGPLYGRELGLALETAIMLSAALFALTVIIAFYRQVWTFRPETTDNVPSSVRAERLFYLIPILTALIIALSIPLLLS